MIFTTSEISTFLTCRRKWKYSSHNHMSLRKTGYAPSALDLGKLVHYGLECALDGNDSPQEAVLDRSEEEAMAAEERYAETVGMGWSDSERDAVNNQANLAAGMVAHHQLYWSEHDPLWPLRAVTTEVSFKVPIPGTDHHLAGTFDAIARHCMNEQLWIVDHKTYTQKPDLRQMDLSMQFRGYIFAAEELFPRECVGGLLYNGLRKALPLVPEPLKNGKLTTAQDKLKQCTYASYLSAIDRANLDPKDYVDQLGQLASTPNNFFTRHEIIRSNARQDAYLATLQAIVPEMAAARDSYVPNFGWTSCTGCQYKSLCEAEENGERLPLERYVRDEYATTAALVLEPTQVSSAYDLGTLLAMEDAEGENK